MGKIQTDLTAISRKLIEIQDEIREYFDWDMSEDVESATRMLSRVEKSDLESWKRQNRLATLSKLHDSLVIRRPEVVVLGAAVEPEEISIALKRPALFVSADGAAGAISELQPSQREMAWSRVVCSVSDADGGEGTLEAVRRAIPIILHAHGHNQEDWKKLLNFAESVQEPPELILTHQTMPEIPGMHNPGGFTDGDRAICFLMSLGLNRNQISLLGTRTDLVGRWSGNTSEPRKMKKLLWMERVLLLNGIEI